MRKKVIAVNTRFLLKDRLEGIGRFTKESLQRICQQHPEIDFVFCFDRPYDESFLFSSNIKPVVINPPARHPLLWYTWYEWMLPSVIKKHKADLFLSTDGFCSLKTETKTAMVVHDIAFEHYPEQVPLAARKYYRHFTPKYVKKADRIATVSSYSKADIVAKYGTNPAKIDVVYNGANDVYQAIENQEKEQIKKELSNGCPYFIFIGAIHPRKNLANILKAFDQFCKENTANPFKLLIAGRKAWQSKAAFEVYENMSNRQEVIFLGHLSIDKLSKVLAGSEALLYPSLFEGFGIPIVEAMYSEVPIISSSVSSMPEVAGDAGILVNPHQPQEILKAMQQIVSDPHLVKQMLNAGKIQREKFSWDKTANRLWECIDKVLNNG